MKPPDTRPDAWAKVQGAAAFVGDLAIPGALAAGVLRSPHPHARIVRIDASRARNLAGVHAVLTARELPAGNVVPSILSDWPLLADRVVRHVGEAIALVAAETAEAAAAAVGAIAVDYEPLAARLDLREALAAGEVLAHYRLRRGEAQLALGLPDVVVVEGVYEIPRLLPLALEPCGVLARPDGRGGMWVTGSIEAPVRVQRAVASALGMDLARVRVVPAVTGGGAAGRLDVPSVIGAQAAVLAAATGRPVQLRLDRRLDMAVTPARHAAWIRMRTGATSEGRLVAAEMECLFDGGAYAALTPPVLLRAVVHACGPYRVPNVHVDAHAVRTHTLPAAPLRGFGVPQVAFAAESQMDLLAERLSLDPLALRRLNVLDVGDETVTGQVLSASVGLKDVLDRVAETAGWDERRAVFSRDTGPLRRGLGLAVSYLGLGSGAERGAADAAAASIAVAPDGSVRVAIGVADTGQGVDAAVARVAAQCLGCPVECVSVVAGDTALVADPGIVSAGHSLAVAGAVWDAAVRVRNAMDGAGIDRALPWRVAVARAAERRVALAAEGWTVARPTSFDPETAQGEPYGGYTFSATAVEVAVDEETGTVEVLRVVSGHDCGRVLHRAAAEGQVAGGVMQGLGAALLEEAVLADGRLANDRLATYPLGTSADGPAIDVVFVPHDHPWGVLGAKGLGGAPVLGVAPAVAAAVAHAVKARLRRLPLTPERIMAALEDRG